MANINRREFQAGLVAAGTAALLAPGAGRGATVAGAHRYSSNLRFRRRKNTYSLWMRVSNLADLAADVPFSVSVAGDAAFQNILYTESYVSHAATSHIVRSRFNLAPRGQQQVARIYCRLLVGETSVPTKIVAMVAV